MFSRIGFGQIWSVNKGGIEAVLAAPVGFTVGFSGHEPDQPLQVHEAAPSGWARLPYAQSLTVRVKQHQLA